jgi:hypothetical protein
VKDVEAMGLVVRIKLRGQRIDRRFGKAPADAAEQHAREHQRVDGHAARDRARADDQASADDEARAAAEQHPAHADLVEEGASDEQRDRKAEKRRAERRANQLTCVERGDGIDPFGLQAAGDRGADRCTRGGREQGQHRQPE